MSFSFNENLILENNAEVYTELVKVEKEQILTIIKNVAKSACTMENLQKEFRSEFPETNHKGEYPEINITGEFIKNYFAIILGGAEKVWYAIVEEIDTMKSFQDVGFYENVYTYLDDLFDEISFDELFKAELIKLNQ